MKILVIGATGMLGSALSRNRVQEDVNIFENHLSLELNNRDQVLNRLVEVKPDVVINTAAYLGVDPCAENPGGAFAINAKAVKDLAEICRQLDITLVHFSSDAVFDGKKGEAYSEADVPNPINMYGMTKYMGDLFVKNICPKHFIIRVPILFGTRENKGSIFIEKMYNLAVAGKNELKISDDVISCPSFSDDIARGALSLIKSGATYGLYHLKNEGVASLYDFARVFFEKIGIKLSLKRAKAHNFAANEKDFKPLNTSIRSIKIAHLRRWEEAMDDFVIQFKNKIKGDKK